MDNDIEIETKSKLLIVDDSEIDRAIIGRIFKDDFEVVSAKNGYEAISYLLDNTDDIAVIILDIFMPLMNGIETLKKIKQIKGLELTPVILMTAEAIPDSLKSGYDHGMADFIVKPIDRYAVYKRVLNIAELYAHKTFARSAKNMERPERKIETHFNMSKIDEYNAKTLKSIVSMYKTRGIETENHLKRVELFVETILQTMMNIGYKTDFDAFKLTEETAKIIAKATVYHDIGLLSLPDAIIKRNIDELSPNDVGVFQTHPKYGTAMLKFNDNPEISDYIKICSNIASYHHERIDGLGYPYGKSADEIPVEAQVAGLAIALDELLCKHCRAEDVNYYESSVDDLSNGVSGKFDSVLLNCIKNIGANVTEILRLYPEPFIHIKE